VAYRDQVEVLRTRRDALRGQLADMRERAEALEWMAARARDLEEELSRVEELLAAADEPFAKLLERMTIRSPCTESWDEMRGDERVRFCAKCEKSVYDLSALPREEAERFLVENTGRACMRLRRRADGTVVTSDCPGAGDRDRRLVTLRRAAAVAIGAAALGAVTAKGISKAVHPETTTVQATTTMGF
jgi:hypothetical protein